MIEKGTKTSFLIVPSVSLTPCCWWKQQTSVRNMAELEPELNVQNAATTISNKTKAKNVCVCRGCVDWSEQKKEATQSAAGTSWSWGSWLLEKLFRRSVGLPKMWNCRFCKWILRCSCLPPQPRLQKRRPKAAKKLVWLTFFLCGSLQLDLPRHQSSYGAKKKKEHWLGCVRVEFWVVGRAGTSWCWNG